VLSAAFIRPTYHSRQCSQEASTHVISRRAQLISCSTKAQLFLFFTETGQFFAMDELFPGRWRQYERRPDSFAETQAKLSRVTSEVAVDRGENLIECLQSTSQNPIRRTLLIVKCSSGYSYVVLPHPSTVRWDGFFFLLINPI
jgi:hypothetical protein